MTATRVTPAALIILVLLPLMIIGCQLGLGAQPPALPAPDMGATDSDQKIVDGYLHVGYTPPCERIPRPAEWVAPIILTDLRSGSYILLNRNGTVKTRSKPQYKSEQGKATLEAVLKDSSVMEQVVARPSCAKQVYKPEVWQRDGWPDPHAEDIGDPPIPKVAMAIARKPTTSPGQRVYPGWIGAYCWPVSGGSRECEDTADWKGFISADPIGPSAGARIFFTVLGDDASPGRLIRIQMFTVQEEWSIWKLGRVLYLGTEVHSVEAQEGETLEEFVVPKLPVGVYMLIASYEFPPGEVEYGFKVAFGK